MTPPPATRPLDHYRRAVDDLIARGVDFSRVEASIIDALLTDDERDALWVHAWSRASMRDRRDFSKGPAHGQAGALAPRRLLSVAPRATG
jgi:hypothetical protein